MKDLRRTVAMGPQQVPAVWSRMLPESFFSLRFPAERRSSCARCPRVVTDGYRPDYRCCTYHPRIPNFQLGLGLGDPATRALVEKAVADGQVLPEGTQHAPAQMIESLAQNADDGFGKGEGALCRFLDLEKKACGIYPYRNSVCATFFCTTDHGAAGVEFWERVQNLVGQVETALSQWVLTKAGFDVAAYFARYDDLAKRIETSTNRATKGWSDAALDLLWGDWRGRELQLLEETARIFATSGDSLYDVACKTPIREPAAFELALSKTLSPRLRCELESEGPTQGQAVPPEDLWYRVQLAHRALWDLPTAEVSLRLSPEVRIVDNPKDDPLGRFHEALPKVAVLGASRWFMSSVEAEILADFGEAKPLAHEDLFSWDVDDPVALASEWLRNGLLIELH